MFCQNCGKKNKDSAHYCYNCGNSLKLTEDEKGNSTTENNRYNNIISENPSQNEELQNNETDFVRISKRNVFYYQTLAKKTNNKDLFNKIAHYYECDTNYYQAISYYEKANNYHSAGFVSEYGLLDDEQALSYYEIGAFKNNDAKCLFKLGEFYYHGCGGLKIDESKAYELFLMSANQNYCRAYVQLAKIYLSGRLVEKDDKTAYEYYIKAIESNNFELQSEKSEIYYAIGDMYLHGNSFIEKDELKAFENYNLAYNLFKESLNSWKLAYCYFEGIGTNKNEEKAMEILSSIEKPSDEAKFYFGLANYYGRGTVKNIERGLYYIKDSITPRCKLGSDWLAENHLDEN